MALAPTLRVLVDPALVMQKADIKSGMRVADLGCGSHGTFVFRAAEKVGASGLVYAVDIQPSVLEAIKSKKQIWPGGDVVEIIWADLEKHGSTTIPVASMDVVMLINVLHQSRQQKQIIEEAVSLVKTGGVLIIVDWSTSEPEFAPQNQFPVSMQNVVSVALGLGLTCIDKFSASRYHFGLKFINK